MLKSIVKALGFIAALLLSGAAGAVSMGGINVTSYLGEPLKAEIDLILASKDDKSKITAHLASPDAFKSAGLNYSDSLPSVKFQIQTRANGTTFLNLTTVQSVNEPFVSLLVDLTWPSGQLIREYTFLLDPPGFKPEQPKPQEIQPLQPIVNSSEQHTEAKKNEPVQTEVAALMGEKTVVASAIKPSPKSSAASKPAKNNEVERGAGASPTAPLDSVTGAIKVSRGDTLRKIAGELKSPDVSLERMVVALYRANENQFDRKNMNRLQTGKILRIPDSSEITKVAQEDAVSEIRAQAEDWNDYRQKLAAAVGTVSEQAPTQKVTGKITATVADKAPTDKKPAKEVVRLSKGETIADKAAVGDKSKSMQEKLNSMEEETIAKNKMLKDENERIALLEKNINDMHRLIELKGKVPQADKAVPVSGEQAQTISGVTPETKPAAASAIVSAVQTQNLSPSKVVEPAPSILDEILANPLYWAGGALLGLGGLGVVLARRRSSSANDEEVQAHTVTHIVEPVPPSPDTGDFTQISAENITEPDEAEETDPIKEAELFLNFGRDVQAEEVLKDALKKEPDNQNVRLKLLSIYEARKDAGNFEALASEVLAAGDMTAWAQAAEMGRALEPANPLYASGPKELVDAGEPIPETVETEQDISIEEFESSSSTPEEIPDAAALVEPLPSHASHEDLDFQHGSMLLGEEIAPAASELAEELRLEPIEATRDVEPEKEQETQSFSESLSMGEKQVELIEDHAKPGLDESDHSFEVSDNSDHVATDQISPVEETAKEKAEMAEMEMPFTLDLPPEASPEVDEIASTEAPKKSLASDAAVDFSEINLNLDEEDEVAPEEIKDTHWHDVATKLDLARAYHEMGDASGAREILEEVLAEGDTQQRDSAQAMLEQLAV